MSAAFHYRIYDKTLIERIRTAVAPIVERRGENSVLTKQELTAQLQQGHTLNDLLAFGPGQDCEIFKADKFHAGDVVIYVPDVSLNHIPLDYAITELEEDVYFVMRGPDMKIGYIRIGTQEQNTIRPELQKMMEYVGRKASQPSDFERVVAQWRNGEITAVEAMRTLKMSKTTFYRKVNQARK